jgi:hypothetical protein
MKEILPIAKRMLAESGEFYPYGGITKIDGSIVHVTAQEKGTMRPKSKMLIDILRKEYQRQAMNREIVACALVFDVRIRQPQ